MLRYPSLQFAGTLEAMGLAAFMKAQTFDDNIVNTIFRLEAARFARDPMNLTYAQSALDTYKRARLDPRTMGLLDTLVLALCSRSLTDIVKDYEQPEDL